MHMYRSMTFNSESVDENTKGNSNIFQICKAVQKFDALEFEHGRLSCLIFSGVDLDGREDIVSSAFLIPVANMENVISHGSAIVMRVGVDYFVTKVIVSIG